MSPTERLAHLRFAIASDLEGRDEIGSSGLAAAGQTDLSYVFPRTTRLAGLNLAAETARRIYDERIPEKGCHHLFRLPANLENQIHHSFLHGDAFAGIDAASTPLDLILQIAPDPADKAKAAEGALDLGELDTGSAKSIHRLTMAYAHAIAAEKTILPYFVLSSDA